jgi:hypothetical protein
MLGPTEDWDKVTVNSGIHPNETVVEMLEFQIKHAL